MSLFSFFFVTFRSVLGDTQSCFIFSVSLIIKLSGLFKLSESLVAELPQFSTTSFFIVDADGVSAGAVADGYSKISRQ
jgi:hypothetical protein